MTKNDIINGLRGQVLETEIASDTKTGKKLVKKTLFRPSSLHVFDKILPTLNEVSWYEILVNNSIVHSANDLRDILDKWDQ